MLQRIRDRSQGWIAGVIIGVISLTFALWGIHNYFGAGSAQGDVVVKVNGYAVTSQEFDTDYQRALQQEQQQMGAAFPDTPAFASYLKRQVLRNIISDRVLSDAALKEGFRVSQPQIDAMLQTVPIFQVNGSFSIARYQQALSALMFTPESFNSTVHRGMLIQQVHSTYSDTAFALPSEVNDAVTLINERRDIQYFIIPASNFTKNTKISDAAIENYYKQRPNQFQAPEQVSLQYIELSAKDILNAIHPTDAQLQQYYQANLPNFTTPARREVSHILVSVPANATPAQIDAAQKKADDLLTQLKGGADFATLAKQNSDDILSAKKGGDLGWVSPGELGQQYDATLATLNTAGALSGVVRTSNGFEILKVVAINPAQTQPFDQVKEKIQKTLVQQQAETQFANESDQLSTLTYENPDTLKQASQALNLPIQTTALFGRSGGDTGITTNQKVIQAAFSDTVLEQGNNSDVIQLDPETLLVIRLNQHKPASLMPLETVKPQIEQVLLTKAAAVKADQQGQQILDELQKGTSPDAIAKQYGATWQTLTAVPRHQMGVDSLILDTAFSVPPPTQSAPIAWTGATMPDGSALVIGVTRVIPGDINKLPKGVTAQEFLTQAEKASGDLDYTIYTLDRLSHANIKPEKSLATDSGS